MFGVGVPELLVLLLLIGAGVVWIVRTLASPDRPGRAGPRQGLVREAPMVGLTRVAGVVVGLGAVALVDGRGSNGTGTMLAPAAFGTCVLLAVVAGETLVRPRTDAVVRSATLDVRRVRDYAPRAWIAVAAVVLLTAALLLLTTLTAGPDPTDGTARSLSCTRGAFGSTTGPYPGSYYSVPLAACLLVMLLVAGLAARQVVRRPRGHGDVGGDDALRRRSLRVVVAATGLTVRFSYLGVTASAASALGNLGNQVGGCAPSWAAPVATVLGLTSLPVLGLVVWCGLVLLRPGAPRPRRADRSSTSSHLPRPAG